MGESNRMDKTWPLDLCHCSKHSQGVGESGSSRMGSNLFPMIGSGTRDELLTVSELDVHSL